MKSYVEASVRQGRRADARAFAREYFRADPKDMQSRLIERADEIITSIHEANHVAYRIPKETFDRYARLPTAGTIHRRQRRTARKPKAPR